MTEYVWNYPSKISLFWMDRSRGKTLRRLAKQGRPASAIAREIGDGCTKDMVGAKMRRMGIVSIANEVLREAKLARDKLTFDRRDERREEGPPAWVTRRVYKVVDLPVEEGWENHPTVVAADLKRHHCRYIIGDAGHCGDTRAHLRTQYCEHHERITHA